MNIGILGGTFDPIHNGHIRLAELAYEQFGLDEVWLMPSPMPPFKPSTCETSYEDRLRMTQLAVTGRPGLTASDYESHVTGNQRSYTADTMKALKDERPEDDLFLILGADSLYTIDTWYHPDVIFRCATIIAASRRYDKSRESLTDVKRLLEKKYSARIKLADSGDYDVSSTEVRRRLRSGESVSDLIPQRVEDYIRQHGLYMQDGDHIWTEANSTG